MVARFIRPAIPGSGGRPLVSNWSVDAEPVARAYELAGMVKITQNAKATFAKVFGTENSTVIIGTSDAPP
jgi:hypothetical protein